MKSLSRLFMAGLPLAAVISLVTTPVAGADSGKPKHSVKDVMKEVHKGDDNIGKRVAKGAASKEEIDKMVAYYESLPLNEPPRGEKDSWAAKTSKLLTAAKAVQRGAPNAGELYKDAANCKACHNAHKPE